MSPSFPLILNFKFYRVVCLMTVCSIKDVVLNQIPHQIPGVKESGWTPGASTAGSGRTLKDTFLDFLSDLDKYSYAWPFRNPGERSVCLC